MTNFDSRPEGRFMPAFREPTSQGPAPEQFVPRMETLTRRPEGQVPSMTNVRRLNLPPGDFGPQGYRYEPATHSKHYSLPRRLGYLVASMIGAAMGLAGLIGGPALAYFALTTAPFVSFIFAVPVAAGLALGVLGAALLVGTRDAFKVAAGKD
ncbi:MAG: hypothetical protein V4449_03025 [Patescibacteria group bacterium]